MKLFIIAGEKTSKNIAHSLGYTDFSVFTRVFKLLTGARLNTLAYRLSHIFVGSSTIQLLLSHAECLVIKMILTSIVLMTTQMIALTNVFTQ